MATKVGKHSITRQMLDQTFHRQTTIICHHFNNAVSIATLLPIHKVNKIKTKPAFFKNDSEVWTFYLHSSTERRQCKVDTRASNDMRNLENYTM